MMNPMYCTRCGTLLAFVNFTVDEEGKERMLRPRLDEWKEVKEDLVHTERYCPNPMCPSDDQIVWEGEEAKGIFAS